MRILLIEDEAELATWLVRALKQSGFVTDHANEVIPGATTPIETLEAMMRTSTGVFADVLGGAIGWLGFGDRLGTLEAGGTMLRFEQG